MNFRSLIPFSRSTDLTRTTNEDPFLALRREMDRMFDDFTRDFTRDFGLPMTQAGNGFLSPRVDVAETDKGLEVTAELPGVNKEDIHLDVSNDVLTLRAERKDEREERDGRRYHVVERAYGTFMRRFALPFEADVDKIEASFDNGVLKVSVPRSPNAEKAVKRIDIKSK